MYIYICMNIYMRGRVCLHPCTHQFTERERERDSMNTPTNNYGVSVRLCSQDLLQSFHAQVHPRGLAARATGGPTTISQPSSRISQPSSRIFGISGVSMQRTTGLSSKMSRVLLCQRGCAAPRTRASARSRSPKHSRVRLLPPLLPTLLLALVLLVLQRECGTEAL